VTSGTVAQGGQTISFTCSNCGATTNAVALGTSIRCPFCGSEHVITAPVAPGLPSIESIVPFEIPDNRVDTLYRQWLGEGFFRPRDIAEKATSHQMRAVYVPIWSCAGSAQSNWSASAGYNRQRQESYTRTDSDGKSVQDTRTVTVTDWRPASGDHADDYDRVLISASKGLPQDWIQRLGGINWQKEIKYDDQYLFGREAETPSIDRASALNFATEEIKEREHDACRNLVPGDTQRDLRVNTRVIDVAGALLYLPVWLGSFQYNEKVYRCVVNGQTGTVSGEAPLSKGRIAMVAVAVLVVIAIIVVIVMVAK
jgi:DNA-directed RNA polymerase subunit RPC12/RpoP